MFIVASLPVADMAFQRCRETSRMATFLSATVPSTKHKTVSLTNSTNNNRNAFELYAASLEAHAPLIKKLSRNTFSAERHFEFPRTPR